MGTAEHKRPSTNDWRIGITPDTEALLRGLEPAFRGHLDTGEREALSDLSDDQLIALFLGWHMRNQKYGFIDMTKPIWVEFTHRAQFAENQRHWQAELIDHWLAARGTFPKNGNILTVDGIDANTMHQLTRRVRELEVFLEKMSHEQMHMLEHDEHEAAMLRLADVPDQLIIDASVYLYACALGRDPLGPFPVHVVEEILHRAAFRAEHIGCVLTFPQESALRPRDRLAFTRARNIDFNDPFWTDERILTAIDLGL